MGAERGLNCEHMQALVTKIFQRHWEWQEDCRNRLASGIQQLSHGFPGEFGREDGIRRGQARSGIKNSHLDRGPRTRCHLAGKMTRIRAARSDVDRRLLVILRQQGKTCMQGEGRIAGSGHGTQARVAVVDKHLQRRGYDITAGP